MGDSISAGSGVSGGGTPNWVSQLNKTGAVTFQNKAVGGATSSTVVASQLAPIVTLAKNGQIDNSVLIIGGNDATSIDGITAIALGDPTEFVEMYYGNVKTVLDAVKAANPNVKQVFVNMPDVTVTPLVQSNAASYGITPAKLALLSSAIDLANTKANAYARSHGVPVVDLYAASQDFVAAVPFTLGGQTFTSLLASDGFHPSNVAQGLIANMIDTAFNVGYGQSLPILSDQKIVQNAGKIPNSATTYFNVSPYIIVPEPATSLLVITTVVLLAAGIWTGNLQGRRRMN
jgi:lysophospholipase L1-like esterase